MSQVAPTDAVRTLLRRAEERLRDLETRGVEQLSASVETVVADARDAASRLIVEAETRAEAIRAPARADAARTLAEADARVEAVIRDAENQAADRSAAVLREAQDRLDALLASEREIHERIQHTMSSLQTLVPPGEPPERTTPTAPRRIA